MKRLLSIQNVSKVFKIRHTHEPYLTLRDSLKGIFKKREKTEMFYALKDISFDVFEGESVGIIGKNGAGKSTLLKILSRITPPASGRILADGRIASLLEVGTGFHPELTGRENIFLNGSVLGMKRSEIAGNFDDIVNFSGVEKFLDTPLKHYSSGMQLRLAFAVAAHLNPEILIIDEVLAVGDAEFQKRCIAKMESVSQSGRTILFVSHNMAAVKQLCQRCIVLKEGKVAYDGNSEKAIELYLGADNVSDVYKRNVKEPLKGNLKTTIEEAWIEDKNGNHSNEFLIGDDISVVFTVVSHTISDKIKLAVQLRSSDGTSLANMIDVDSRYDSQYIEGKKQIRVTVKDIRFYPDLYYFSIWAGDANSMDVFDFAEDCLRFHVVNGGNLTSRHLPRSAGLLFLTPEWK